MHSGNEKGSENKKPAHQKHEMVSLPHGFTPGPCDVLCAVGKDAKKHEGNVRFRHFVDQVSREYGSTTSKLKKTDIVSRIISSVRSQNGGFVKFQHGQWVDVGDAAAREKVGQCLRENNHDMYRSSTKMKRKKRKELNDRLGDRVSLVMSQNEIVANEIHKLRSTIEQFQENNAAQDENRAVAVTPQRNTARAAPPTLTDSELELEMTRANVRILASLKTDSCLQDIIKNADDRAKEPTSE